METLNAVKLPVRWLAPRGCWKSLRLLSITWSWPRLGPALWWEARFAGEPLDGCRLIILVYFDRLRRREWSASGVYDPDGRLQGYFLTQ